MAVGDSGGWAGRSGSGLLDSMIVRGHNTPVVFFFQCSQCVCVKIITYLTET